MVDTVGGDGVGVGAVVDVMGVESSGDVTWDDLLEAVLSEMVLSERNGSVKLCHMNHGNLVRL